MPGYGFMLGIIPRWGLVGSFALGLGVLGVFLSAVLADRSTT